MIYCAIAASLGYNTMYEAIPIGEKWLALFGLVCYVGSLFCGAYLEARLNTRIKKLEKEMKEK